jgi:hypothetical protein
LHAGNVVLNVHRMADVFLELSHELNNDPYSREKQQLLLLVVVVVVQQQQHQLSTGLIDCCDENAKSRSEPYYDEVMQAGEFRLVTVYAKSVSALPEITLALFYRIYHIKSC